MVEKKCTVCGKTIKEQSSVLWQMRNPWIWRTTSLRPITWWNLQMVTISAIWN